MNLFILTVFNLLCTCHALGLQSPKPTSAHKSHPPDSSPRTTQAPQYGIAGRGLGTQTVVWAHNNTCGYLNGIRSTQLRALQRM